LHFSILLHDIKRDKFSGKNGAARLLSTAKNNIITGNISTVGRREGGD